MLTNFIIFNEFIRVDSHFGVYITDFPIRMFHKVIVLSEYINYFLRQETFRIVGKFGGI